MADRAGTAQVAKGVRFGSILHIACGPGTVRVTERTKDVYPLERAASSWGSSMLKYHYS